MSEPVFFWGHRPGADGRVGPSCLSQWWPAPFALDGHEFATAEHYMMWRKARLFDDGAVAGAVLAARDPAEAKRLGRAVSGFRTADWARHRFDVVVAGNLAKFTQHEPLRAFLLDTGDRLLVEASPEDALWGIGLAADHPDAAEPDRWPGQNLLGQALMRVRAELHG